MNYPLDLLVKVRDYREIATGNNLQMSKAAHEEAAMKVSLKEDTLSNYRSWKNREKEQLYSEITNRCITLKDLRYLEISLKELKAKEIALEAEYLEAEKTCHETGAMVEQARASHLQSIKKKEALGIHKNMWHSNEKQRHEKIEEHETDEFLMRRVFDENKNEETII